MQIYTIYQDCKTEGVLLTLQELNKDVDEVELEKIFREMLIALHYTEDEINHYVDYYFR